MTPFRAAMTLCGLTVKTAADYLGIPKDTVKSYAQGKYNPNERVWLDLAYLWKYIDQGKIEYLVQDQQEIAKALQHLRGMTE